MAALTTNFFRSFLKKLKFSRQIGHFQPVIDVLREKPSQEIKNIQGWVKGLRKMKGVIFVDVNDGSCPDHIQIVIPTANKPAGISNGCSVQASGSLAHNPSGQLELQATSLKIVGVCNGEKFPFKAKQKHSHDYCRQYIEFRPKLSHFQSLLRVRHRALLIMHEWFEENGFLGVHTPILTSNDCEGTGEVFSVVPENPSLVNEMRKKGQRDAEAFFGKPAYLSVSGQLHLEAITRGFSKCYSISPTFRAENNRSRLHLSEFYMVEAEEAFVDNIDSLLLTIESLVRHSVRKILDKSSEDLAIIAKHNDEVDLIKKLEEFVDKEFIRLPYKNAREMVREKFPDVGSGFSKDEELFLVERFNNSPVFITDWPKTMKPFYMKTQADDLVSAVDLLVPNVGELCGGSVREDNVEALEARMKEEKILDSVGWYLDIRKFGNVPTAGFGLGFERFLQLVTGLGNIKDTIPFPRWPHNLKV